MSQDKRNSRTLRGSGVSFVSGVDGELAEKFPGGDANDSDFVVLDEQDLMLGIMTFAIQSDRVGRSHSTAELRDASLDPVADLSARRDR